MRTIVVRFAGDFVGSARRGDWRGALAAVVDAITFVMALAAAAALVARHGFYLDERLEGIAELVSRVVLYGFLGQILAKVALVRARMQYLRTHLVEVILAILLLLVLVLPGQIGAILKAWDPLLTPASVANWYVAITQVSLLLAFLPAALRASRRLTSVQVQPSLLILLSFAILVLLGTGALLLPRATTAGRIRFIDALFTAASASCVTGLTVVDTVSAFTSLGKGVILALMQVGGLGIMTLTSFFAAISVRRGSLKEYATLQALFGEDTIGRIRQIAVQIALTTLAFELAGAALIFAFLDRWPVAGPIQRLFLAVFHSVSAFCNAGFSLFPEGLANPLLRGNAPLLYTVMGLIAFGGLGFPVLRNLAQVIVPRRHGTRRPRLTLHTRIVLVVTVTLIGLGAVAFWLLERHNTLIQESAPGALLHAFFQSVTARTAGFNTVDIGTLAAPSLLLIVALMWIGASPGSTGGGIKTTSFAIVLLEVRSIARGRESVELRRTRLDPSSVARAHATVFLSLALIAAAFMALVVTERQSFLALLFETVSAAGTVGLSTGITSRLSEVGKAVIIVLMFVGRVGFLTLAMALMPPARRSRTGFAAESVPVL